MSLASLDKLRHPKEYLDFIEWIALPRSYRNPQTQKEFAQQLGVSEDTLTDWKKRSGFWDSVSGTRRATMIEKSGNVLESLYRRILREGRGADVKLLLQYTGEWKELEEDREKLHPRIQEALDKIANFL